MCVIINHSGIELSFIFIWIFIFKKICDIIYLTFCLCLHPAFHFSVQRSSKLSRFPTLITRFKKVAYISVTTSPEKIAIFVTVATVLTLPSINTTNRSDKIGTSGFFCDCANSFRITKYNVVVVTYWKKLQDILYR